MSRKSLKDTYILAIAVVAVIVCAVAVWTFASSQRGAVDSTRVYVDFAAEEWDSEHSTPVGVHVSGDGVDEWLTFTADDVAYADAFFDCGEGDLTVTFVSPIRDDGVVWALSPATSEITALRQPEDVLQSVHVEGTHDDSDAMADAVVSLWLDGGFDGGVKSDIRALAKELGIEAETEH